MADALVLRHDTTWKFPRQLSGKWRVMTLEPGTCCYRAVSFFGRAFQEPPELVLVSSFPDGIQKARGAREIVLLPHVHETSSALTTDAEWDQLVDWTFPYENPPLVLARRADATASPNAQCAAIERLIPLAADAEGGNLQFEVVQTTQEAARACASPYGPQFCITNQHGADHYGLDVLRVLKHMTIWWMPFRHAPTEEEHV